MARGKRQRFGGAGLRLSDGDGRTRLTPAVSPRARLRERYRNVVEANGELASRPWWPDAEASVEQVIVDAPDLEDARAAVTALEELNSPQQAALLAHYWARAEGEIPLVWEYLSADGDMIARVTTDAECESLCREVMAPLPWPDAEAEEVFALYDARGAARGLLVGVHTEPVTEGLVDRFLLREAIGLIPSWDDRDPMWDNDWAAVIEGYGESALVVRGWLAQLRQQGTEVAWESGERWRVLSCAALVAFDDRFCWSARRFLDGFDERFEIPGPPAEVELRLSVADCVQWVAHEAVLWKIDPEHVADALVNAVTLLGGDIAALPAEALEAAVAYSAPDAGGYTEAERLEQIQIFCDRLDLLVAGGGSASTGTG